MPADEDRGTACYVADVCGCNVTAVDLNHCDPNGPARQMMRSVPRDTTLGGIDIAAGSTALLLFAAGNRDPAQFANPDRVDLKRGSPSVT